MLELILIRHPESKANTEGIIQGQTDIIVKQGYETDLEQVAVDLLEGGQINAFLSSDLERAYDPSRHLLDILRNYQNSLPIEHVSTSYLRERSWGVLEGTNCKDLPCGDKNPLEYLYSLDKISNGEGHEEINKRIMDFKERHLQKYSGRVVIVGHLFFSNYLRNSLEDGNIISRPFEYFKNLSITKINV